MRIALVVHGLPPRERTGVENHVAALAVALSRAGAEVLVLAARKECDLPHLAERRERREGYVVDWLVLNEPPRDALEEAAPTGVAEAVGEWLDREQPDVVHVHHVKGLGWGVLEAVRGRGLPLVFSAHDYYAVCHRVTHQRPDLVRCEVLGEPERCARCDLAVGVLHGRAELGDWHVGVFPDLLPIELRERLSRALEGDLPEQDLQGALEQRRQADAKRAWALGCADLVLAPTQRMLEALAQGGIQREKLRLMPYAIDTRALAGLPPPAADDAAPLRFGFLGGMAKHKGAHVVVEAFAGVRDAELHLFGDSTDRPYVERVRSLCAQTGAIWHGSYEPRALDQILAGLDVLCLPSLWDENAPFVIREAFAAGRPVLASRIGALPESVRDGVDGLLIAPGDVTAWRAALGRLAGDRALVRRLAGGVRPPPPLEALAGDLLALHGELLARRAAGQWAQGLPEHLWGFQGRRAVLQRLPLDELHARTRSGLSRLRARLLPQTKSALSTGTGAELERARELVRDGERRARWVDARAAEDRRARESLAAEARWLSSLLAERERELAWRHEEAAARTECHARELEQLRTQVAAREAEALWLRELAAALERQRDAAEAERDENQRALATFAAHERWLREELRGLAAALGATEASADGAPIAPEGLAEALAAARSRVASLGAELGWRRAEMEQARSDGGPLLRALVGQSALGKRFDGWRERRAEEAP